tara:strand:+ start:429 stop:2774 length:2346 start_codon:yes stop_codon:yes gene_type:complete
MYGVFKKMFIWGSNNERSGAKPPKSSPSSPSKNPVSKLRSTPVISVALNQGLVPVRPKLTTNQEKCDLIDELRLFFDKREGVNDELYYCDDLYKLETEFISSLSRRGSVLLEESSELKRTKGGFSEISRTAKFGAKKPSDLSNFMKESQQASVKLGDSFFKYVSPDKMPELLKILGSFLGSTTQQGSLSPRDKELVSKCPCALVQHGNQGDDRMILLRQARPNSIERQATGIGLSVIDRDTMISEKGIDYHVLKLQNQWKGLVSLKSKLESGSLEADSLASAKEIISKLKKIMRKEQRDLNNTLYRYGKKLHYNSDTDQLESVFLFGYTGAMDKTKTDVLGFGENESKYVKQVSESYNTLQHRDLRTDSDAQIKLCGLFYVSISGFATQGAGVDSAKEFWTKPVVHKLVSKSTDDPRQVVCDHNKEQLHTVFELLQETMVDRHTDEWSETFKRLIDRYFEVYEIITDKSKILEDPFIKDCLDTIVNKVTNGATMQTRTENQFCQWLKYLSADDKEASFKPLTEHLGINAYYDLTGVSPIEYCKSGADRTTIGMSMFLAQQTLKSQDGIKDDEYDKKFKAEWIYEAAMQAPSVLMLSRSMKEDAAGTLDDQVYLKWNVAPLNKHHPNEQAIAGTIMRGIVSDDDSFKILLNKITDENLVDILIGIEMMQKTKKGKKPLEVKENMILEKLRKENRLKKLFESKVIPIDTYMDFYKYIKAQKFEKYKSINGLSASQAVSMSEVRLEVSSDESSEVSSDGSLEGSLDALLKEPDLDPEQLQDILL